MCTAQVCRLPQSLRGYEILLYRMVPWLAYAYMSRLSPDWVRFNWHHLPWIGFCLTSCFRAALIVRKTCLFQISAGNFVYYVDNISTHPLLSSPRVFKESQS